MLSRILCEEVEEKEEEEEEMQILCTATVRGVMETGVCALGAPHMTVGQEAQSRIEEGVRP